MSSPFDSAKKRALEDLLSREDPGRETTALGVVLALVSIGEFPLVRFFLNSMLEKGLHPGSIMEILLQSHLFAGFPRAINGLKIFADLLNAFQIDQGSVHHEECGEDLAGRGRALFGRVYGRNAATVLESLHALHPSYDQWILEDAYGRVLSRPHLSGRIRELCAVAALTACGVKDQLRSHILGAVHLGAAKEEVLASIRSVSALSDEKKIDDALEIMASLDLK